MLLGLVAIAISRLRDDAPFDRVHAVPTNDPTTSVTLPQNPFERERKVRSAFRAPGSLPEDLGTVVALLAVITAVSTNPVAAA